MSETQKWIIDQKDEAGIRDTISILMATKHKDKESLIEYCESRLKSLNVEDAIVPEPDLTGFGE